VNAWRITLEARGLGSISINVRITAVRKLAIEAADNGLLAPELAAGITRCQGYRIQRRPGGELAVPLAGSEAPECLGRDHQERPPRSSDVRHASGLRASPVRGSGAYGQAHAATGQSMVHRGPHREARPCAHDSDADMGEGRHGCLDNGGRYRGRSRAPAR
jgi:hypothetical protein